MDRFEPNLRIPGPTGPAAVRPRRRRAPDDQPPRPRVRGDARADPDRHEAVLRDDLGRRDDHDRRDPAGSRRPSSTRSRRATASSASRSARSATGSPRSPGSTARTSRSSMPSGATPRRPTRSASSSAPMPGVKAVLLTHNETSTGVMNPIPELAAAVREEAPDALILVDSVSGLGAVPFEMDAWGVDVVVTGSQKAWMSAPGLAMIAASPRAWAAMETATMPRFYLDLRAHRERHANGQTPFTPAHRGRLPGRRGPAADGRGGRRPRSSPATRRARPRRGPGWPRSGFELLADPRVASRTVTAALRPRRPRLEGVQRRGQAARRRPRRRPGQADRQDLPARPPRVGHARGDPRRA